MRESFIAIMVVMLMASCTRGDAMRNEGDATSVTEISVVTEPLVTADSVTRADDEDKTGSDAVDDIEDMTAENIFENGESLLYISQLGNTINTNFNEEISDIELYNNNLYVYKYYENNSATWDKEFNFKKEGDAPIQWQDILKRGSVGNAFSFYALHFPVENKVRFSVEKNQKKLEDFQKSDIMGAYHATSSLYSRMRFRLYHLMTYLRVTLYVPVYKEPENPEDDKSQSTGFKAGAVKNAFLKDVYTDFNIGWRVNRSSDNDAPFVMSAGDKTDYVFMYEHESNKENQEPIHITNIKTEFYKDNTVDEDEVYVYNFSVLVPTQKIDINDQFMQFQLRPVGSGEDDEEFNKEKTKLTNYYFQTSQLMEGSNTFQLTQGALEHLTLYLPRTGNDVILVGAKIVNWKDASSDMTVTKQPQKGDDKGGNDGEDKGDGDGDD